MKNITLLFLLCSLSAHAQTTTKSFVLSTDGVNYLEVTRTTADDGLSYSEYATLVGPASALAADQADKIEARMSNIAASAYVVSLTSRRLNEEAKVDSVINALTTLSPLKVIQDRYQAALTASGWTIDQGAGAGFVPLVFTVNGSGVLRYSVNGAATKQATIYGGSLIKLFNYPSSGTNTSFYLDESGKKYFSLPNRGSIIKKP
jgi:hypothetical protein